MGDNIVKEQILAVQKMQDYIDLHLKDEITLADLSKVSLFSPWYSHRMFAEQTGVSPAEYIRKLKLAKAVKYLKNEEMTVTDIAFELGFGSVDGFIRAFFREFGITPGEYKKNPVPVSLFISYGVKYKEIEKEKKDMEKTHNVFIQVVHKPERNVIIKRGVKATEYWDYCNEVGCDVWGTLMSMDSLCKEPVCLWLPEKYIKKNTSKYVQGVEVDLNYNGVIPEDFDIITLPSADYLMFQGEKFNEEDFVMAITRVQQSMETYDPKTIGYEWDNDNPRIQLEPRGERGYIELKAVKPLK